MVHVVSAQQARRQFGEIMNMVYYQGESVIVERAGKPMVRIVKPRSKTTSAKKKEAKEVADALIGSLDLSTIPDGLLTDIPQADREKIDAFRKEFRDTFHITQT